VFSHDRSPVGDVFTCDMPQVNRLVNLPISIHPRGKYQGNSQFLQVSLRPKNKPTPHKDEYYWGSQKKKKGKEKKRKKEKGLNRAGEHDDYIQ
jgi:hypothetical protein